MKKDRFDIVGDLSFSGMRAKFVLTDSPGLSSVQIVCHYATVKLMSCKVGVKKLKLPVVLRFGKVTDT
jgi:hypothetical protein